MAGRMHAPLGRALHCLWMQQASIHQDHGDLCVSLLWMRMRMCSAPIFLDDQPRSPSHATDEGFASRTMAGPGCSDAICTARGC